MPTTQYAQDTQEAPPILPSNTDFGTVLSGLNSGFQQSTINAYNQAQAARQAAAEQAQQQFDNDSKTRAANLATAQFWEQYGQDNSGPDPDDQNADLNKRITAVQEYVAKNYATLNSMAPDQQKQFAKTAYEQTGGHVNYLGAKGVADVYGNDPPVFNPYTGQQTGGANYQPGNAPSPPDVSAAKLARVLGGEDPAVVFGDTTATPPSPAATPVSPTPPPVTATSATASASPPSAPTAAPATGPDSDTPVTPADPSQTMMAVTTPKPTLTAADLATPPTGYTLGPSATPTLTADDLQGLLSNPGGPAQATQPVAGPLTAAALQTTGQGGVVGQGGLKGQGAAAVGGPLTAASLNSPSATGTGPAQSVSGPLTSATLNQTSWAATAPSLAATTAPPQGPLTLADVQDYPVTGAPTGQTVPDPSGTAAPTSPATSAKSPTPASPDDTWAVPPELRGIAPGTNPRVDALVAYIKSGGKVVPTGLDSPGGSPTLDGMDRDDWNDAVTYYVGRSGIGDNGTNEEKDDDTGKVEVDDPLNLMADGSKTPMPRPAPWTPTPPAAPVTGPLTAASLQPGTTADDNLFGYRAGYVSPEDLKVETLQQKQASLVALQRQHDAAFLQNLPKTLSALAQEPPMTQASVIQQINQQEGLSIPVPWTKDSNGNTVPPIPLDPIKLKQIANQTAALVIQRQNAMVRAKLGEAQIDLGLQRLQQQGSQFAQTMGLKSQEFQAKTGPDGPLGQAVSKDADQIAKAQAAYDKANKASTADDPSQDPAVIEAQTVLKNAQDQYGLDNSRLQNNRGDDTYAQSYVGTAGAHDGCAHFVRNVMGDLGPDVPPTDNAAQFERQLPQYGWQPVSPQMAKPNDIVVMPGTGPSGRHVGVYVGGGHMVNDSGIKAPHTVTNDPVPDDAQYYTYVDSSAAPNPQGPLTKSSLTPPPPGLAGRTAPLPGGGTVTYPPASLPHQAMSAALSAAAEYRRRHPNGN